MVFKILKIIKYKITPPPFFLITEFVKKKKKKIISNFRIFGYLNLRKDFVVVVVV